MINILQSIYEHIYLMFCPTFKEFNTQAVNEYVSFYEYLVIAKGIYKGIKYSITSQGVYPTIKLYFPKNNPIYGKVKGGTLRDFKCHGNKFTTYQTRFYDIPFKPYWVIQIDYNQYGDFLPEFYCNEYLFKNTHVWSSLELLDEVKKCIDSNEVQ